MNEHQIVRLINAAANLSQKVVCPTWRKRPKLGHKVGQRETFEEFHHVIKGCVLGLTVVVNLDRIGVRELCGGSDLAFKRGRAPGALVPRRT